MLLRDLAAVSPLAYTGQEWRGAYTRNSRIAGLETSGFQSGRLRYSAACALESKASRGVFGVERFSFGRLSELVGHEMQHGGQKSEAGGGK
jgi:hypothetical protein